MLAALLEDVLNNEFNCSNNGATLAASSTLTLGACCCNLSRRILSTRGAQVGFRDWWRVKPCGMEKRLEQLGLRHDMHALRLRDMVNDFVVAQKWTTKEVR